MRRDGSMWRYGQHRGFFEHLKQSFGPTEPVPCRHCKADGACPCGQEHAELLFDAARALPIPKGSAMADREARDFGKAAGPKGPYTRPQVLVLRSALESLASWWRLARSDAATLDRVESLIRASQAVETDLP